MTETFVPSSLETSGGSETVSEASEQDIVRVSESMQKAKQIGAQIGASQIQNTKLAHFLTYLLNTVQDENIWIILIDLFSKPDVTTSSNTANMALAVNEMVALFLPFYMSKVEELDMQELFQEVSYQISLDEHSYIQYIHALYQAYPLYGQLDKDILSSLLTAILVYHGLTKEEEERDLQKIVNEVRAALG